MQTSEFEIIHTITDWYDGARGGLADLGGVPHYYECRWDDATDDWSEVYLLNRIDEETFRFAMEAWAIWLRWRKAFDEGKTKQETHPALPKDRARHNKLEEVLAQRLVIKDEALIKAKGEFKYGEPTLVKWTVVT